MALHPQAIPPIPEETARVAQAVFPKGNGYMKLRDELVQSRCAIRGKQEGSGRHFLPGACMREASAPRFL